MQVVSTATALPLARAVSAALDTKPLILQTRTFSNGQIEVNLQASIRPRADVALIQTFPDRVHDRLIETFLALDLLRAHGARVTAVLPYLPYSRSDAPVSQGGPVPARLLASLLESAGADCVVTVDLHTPQLRGCFRCPVIEVETSHRFAEHFRTLALGPTVVVSPDLGGGKRAERLALQLETPLAVMRKKRQGGRKQSFDLLGEVSGLATIVLDDEVNSGETLLSAAELLRTYGARAIYGVATHAMFTPEVKTRLEESIVDGIVVSDSIPVNRSSLKFDVVPIGDDIANALLC